MDRGFSRRKFMAGAGVAAGAAALSPQIFASSFASESIAAGRLEEFEYGAVQLKGGPLKEQYDRIHASYLALDNDRLLKVYRQRAGLPAPGAAMGGWYDADGFVPGHTLGQYISGLARIGKTTGDPDCALKATELVDGFGATLGSKNQVFAGSNAEKVWPCYILDKHMAGLLDAYNLSGVDQARELLPRVYQGALPYIPEQGRDRVGKKLPPYDETYVLPETLFSAAALTGDVAMRQRAAAYLLDRDFFDPLARGEDVLPGRHAYSHAIALSSAGKAHLMLGDDKYLSAMKNAWQFLAASQQYASGGWGPNETFIEPHKGQLYDSLRSTDDHFETPCGSYAAMKLARYLICATGDGRYGDGLERVVYNTILGVKEPDSDGDYPYYSTYGANARKVYYQKKWPCCSGTLVQGVADYVKNIYFRTPGGVAVNMYVPSEVKWNQDGDAIMLSQRTDYPAGETITLRIDAPKPTQFDLWLRMPGWLERSPVVRVNNKPVAVETVRGFAILKRRWSQGDTITLELRQSFRKEAIDDLHPETVAVMRGPLMYVEVNPASAETPSVLASFDAMHPVAEAPGLYCAHVSLRERVYAPFYTVRAESYTTYFQKS